MNWVINHLVSLSRDGIFLSPAMQFFCCRLTMTDFFLFVRFCVHPWLYFWITNNPKESLFKTVANLGWMEMRQRKEMVKPVICDGSLPYRKKHSSLFWHDNLSLVTAAFSLRAWGNKQQFSVSLCRQDKSGVFHCWVHSAWAGQGWTII